MRFRAIARISLAFVLAADSVPSFGFSDSAPARCNVALTEFREQALIAGLVQGFTSLKKIAAKLRRDEGADVVGRDNLLLSAPRIDPTESQVTGPTEHVNTGIPVVPIDQRKSWAGVQRWWRHVREGRLAVRLHTGSTAEAAPFFQNGRAVFVGGLPGQPLSRRAIVVFQVGRLPVSLGHFLSTLGQVLPQGVALNSPMTVRLNGKVIDEPSSTLLEAGPAFPVVDLTVQESQAAYVEIPSYHGASRLPTVPFGRHRMMSSWVPASLDVSEGMVAVGTEGATILLFDTSGKELVRAAVPGAIGGGPSSLRIVRTPHGPYVVYDQFGIKWFAIEGTEQQMGELKHRGGMYNIVVTASGRTGVLLQPSHGKPEASLLTVGTPFRETRLASLPSDHRAMAISMDGKFVVTGGLVSGTNLWDATDGRLLQTWPMLPASQLAFTQDAQGQPVLLAFAGDHYSSRLEVYQLGIDWESGWAYRLAARLDIRSVIGLDTHPSGLIAVADESRTVTILDLANPTAPRPVAQGHVDSLPQSGRLALRFSPDRQFLYVGRWSESTVVERWTLPPSDLPAIPSPQTLQRIPAPRAGSTEGHVNDAIGSAYGRLNAGRIDVHAAAGEIFDALVTMEEPEYLTNIQTAIAIFRKSGQPQWDAVIAVLDRFAQQTDHTGIRDEMQRIFGKTITTQRTAGAIAKSQGRSQLPSLHSPGRRVFGAVMPENVRLWYAERYWNRKISELWNQNHVSDPTGWNILDPTAATSIAEGIRQDPLLQQAEMSRTLNGSSRERLLRNLYFQTWEAIELKAMDSGTHGGREERFAKHNKMLQLLTSEPLSQDAAGQLLDALYAAWTSHQLEFMRREAVPLIGVERQIAVEVLQRLSTLMPRPVFDEWIHLLGSSEDIYRMMSLPSVLARWDEVLDPQIARVSFSGISPELQKAIQQASQSTTNYLMAVKQAMTSRAFHGYAWERAWNTPRDDWMAVEQRAMKENVIVAQSFARTVLGILPAFNRLMHPVNRWEYPKLVAWISQYSLATLADPGSIEMERLNAVRALGATMGTKVHETALAARLRGEGTAHQPALAAKSVDPEEIPIVKLTRQPTESVPDNNRKQLSRPEAHSELIRRLPDAWQRSLSWITLSRLAEVYHSVIVFGLGGWKHYRQQPQRWHSVDLSGGTPWKVAVSQLTEFIFSATLGGSLLSVGAFIGPVNPLGWPLLVVGTATLARVIGDLLLIRNNPHHEIRQGIDFFRDRTFATAA